MPSSPNWTTGYVPPTSEWNALWASKLDSGSTSTTRQEIVGNLAAAATNAPASRGDYSSITTAFTGDLSQIGWAFPYTISGAATLGEPSTGYLYTPECSMYFDYLLNESGWNQSTSSNTGRTAATAHFTKVDNYGQGDCMGYVVLGFVDSARSGATSWLANPAITAYAADMQAGAAGVYLNPIEIDCTDNGHDIAAINFVGNATRTVATATLGEPWIILRGQSNGSAAIDAFLSASGPMTIGLDLTTAAIGTGQGAITLAQNQRIYFGATNAGGFPLGTNPTGSYIEETGGILTLTNGGGQVQISSSGEVALGELQTNNIVPTADNAYVLGGSAARYTALWAVNGAIQTSDPALKTNIKPLPPATPIVMAIEPITFQWKDGGFDVVEAQETQATQATETVTADVEEIQVVNGVPTLVKTSKQVERPIFDSVGVVDATGKPVMVNVAAKNEPPRMVQRTHKVPRMVQKTVTVTKQVPRPGKRTHWGFAADSIKSATPAGMDWAAYVKGEDGTEHIRPDQLIPVLWKAVQELSAEVALLKAR